jgi:asparagine synthase (glutamine-hydrolysing)
MQWVIGFVPRIPNAHPQFTPRQLAELLPQPTGIFWNCGFRTSEVRQFRTFGRTVTVVGRCFATDNELKGVSSHADTDHSSYMQWPGAYVVAIATTTSVTVLAPVSGLVPVYYVETGEGYWWSIETETDDTAIAFDLSTIGVNAVSKDATFFVEVKRLPPGMALEIEGGVISLSSWHSFEYHDDIDVAADALRSALGDSIERACGENETLVVDVSGGLDSGTLVSLAARHSRVIGVTFVTPEMRNDDLKYARLLVEALGIEQRIVEGDDSTLHYTDVDAIPWTDQPSNDAILMGYNRAKQRAVADVAPGLYMTGTGGDCVLNANPTHLCDLYRRDRRAGLRAARGEARRLTAPFVQTAFAMRRSANRTYSASLVDLAAQITSGGVSFDDKSRGVAPFNAAKSVDWLTVRARKKVGARISSLAIHVPDPMLMSNAGDLNDLQNIGLARQVCHSLGADSGLSFYHPFFDTGVVDACLSLEGAARIGGSGFKPILRKAFGDVLPEELLERRTKGSFGGMMYAGLRRNAPALRSLVADSVLAQRGIVDVTPIEGALTAAVNGLRAPLADLHRFVVLENWLRQVRLARTEWWEENAAA